MSGMVYFVGAGPGDPELVTVKGKHVIESADLVLYAGSLVPAALVTGAKKSALVLDSSSMTLEETHATLLQTVRAGGLAARVHTGDPSLYGALREQTALLDAAGVPWKVIPGVTAAFAAAALAGVSFTSPETAQSLIFCRVAGKTKTPQAQSPGALAKTGAPLAIYLSAASAEKLRDELLTALPPSTPVICVQRAGWPGEKIIRCALKELAESARGLERQTIFLVLPAETAKIASRLYDKSFSHGFRKAEDKSEN